ncbi:MAG: aldehyde dehydrogenase family protein [Microbacteriaceae bacterium]
MAITTVNPTTAAAIASYDEMSAGDVDRVLAGVAAEQLRWAALSPAERGSQLARLAEILEGTATQLAELAVTEMGKPLAQAHAEVAKSVATVRWYAKEVERLSATRPVPGTDGTAEVRLAPLGVVLAVMPWNYPVWQVIRAGIPALAAGNALVVKHAAIVTGSALLLRDVFATWRPNTVDFVVVRGGGVADVIRDDRIDGVTLTGSCAAGVSVAEVAGQVLKPCVLELGGSDPFIVLPDVDVDAVVAAAVQARFQNNGQSCIAAKRLIVHRDVAPAFTEAFVEAVRGLRVGDPFADTTDVGPVAQSSARDELEAIVRGSVAWGATVLTGGGRPSDQGWFVAPTVLGDVGAGCPAVVEETFGPVAALEVVASVDDAVLRANDTAFGLGAAVWTRDTAIATAVADRLAAGTVTINGITASDPRIPIGGTKASGYGRELGDLGLMAFTNQKSVVVKG